MVFARRRFLPAFLLLLGGVVSPFATHAQKTLDATEQSAIEHMREELGVNAFTAPSIELLFTELQQLKPIPFDKVWRDLPANTPADRPRLALTAGGVIADGFLAVAAERQSRVETVGRVLLRLAKGLGVGDHVTKHSKSIIEKSARSQWADVKQELVRAQAEVEVGMMALKDEELAHLVSLGGWLRGLEIASGIVLDNYSPERSQTLVQPELLDYFIDRVGTLNPDLKKDALFAAVETRLGDIKRLTVKQEPGPLTEAEVKQLRDWARDLNRQIAAPARR